MNLHQNMTQETRASLLYTFLAQLSPACIRGVTITIQSSKLQKPRNPSLVAVDTPSSKLTALLVIIQYSFFSSISAVS